MPIRCAKCGFDSPDEMKFCGECGTALRTEPARDDAERRQLTVMFCDLADSTGLAERLELEVLREVIQEYQRTCGEIVARFGGTIAQYLGDGILAYFGWPEAHEDDARRAALAALDILTATQRLDRDATARHDARIAVRIGMHTGLVVAGEVGGRARREQLALGPTPNVAARLQSLAEPGTAVLSAQVHRLIEHHFECEPLGISPLKGVTGPVAAYRLLRERPGAGRLRSGGPPTLVGRETETAALIADFARAANGEPRAVLITAGPGLGKSALTHLLEQRTTELGSHWLVARCNSYYADSAFQPLAELLRRTLNVVQGDPADWQLQQLARGAGSFGLAKDAVPLLADLLSIPLRGEWTAPAMTPQRMKAKALEQIRTLLTRLATKTPVVFVLEDHHWADPSTREFVDGLVADPPTPRLLVVVTARPPTDPPWARNGGGRATRLELEPLSDLQVRGIVERMTAGKALPEDVLAHITSRTDGVPLFVEEMTRMLLESGLLVEEGDRWVLAGPLPLHGIPSTLHDSLMARLDRQADAKSVAQWAAVIGREAGVTLLRAVVPEAALVLDQALEQLVEAQLLVPRAGEGLQGETVYTFRHALIQDAAYESLLKNRRQELHRTVAAALEEGFTALTETHPEILGHHYAAAGLAEPAVDRWIQAGQLAVSRGTNREAVLHLEHGLALVEDLPEGPSRDAKALVLWNLLGAARTPLFGYAAPPVEEAYTRAGELADRLGDTPHLFWVVWGLSTFYIVRAQLDTALEFNERMIRMAGLQEDPVVRREAHFAMAVTHFFRGEFSAARNHLDDLLAEVFPDGIPDPIGPLPAPATPHVAGVHHELVTGCACASLVDWHLGDVDRARAMSRASIAIARSTGSPHALGYAYTYAARLHESLGNPATSAELARQVIAISEEHGLFWITQGWFFLGRALADAHLAAGELGASLDDAVGLMRKGIDGFRGTGALVSQTYMLGLLAETELKRGRYGPAERAIAEARAAVEPTGERYWVPDLERMVGELALARGDAAEAVARFRAASVAARAQGCMALAGRAEERLAAIQS